MIASIFALHKHPFEFQNNKSDRKERTLVDHGPVAGSLPAYSFSHQTNLHEVKTA
jgi:hypothetical protein